MKLRSAQYIDLIYNSTKINGGITINRYGSIPSTGYVVSAEGAEQIIPLDKFTKAKVAQYIDNNIEALNRGFHLGTWVDEGKVYFDLSIVYHSLGSAWAACKINKQVAFYYIDEDKVIKV